MAPIRGRWSSAAAVSRKASSRKFVQIFLGEKILQRGGGAVGGINLSQLQPFAQFLGGQVNVHNLVGLQHEAVGHALAHVHARRAQHRVVQAFEVLDVHAP